MSDFIGRQAELDTLSSLFTREIAHLIVIKGRRRIGKSRLLEEFGKQFDRVYNFMGTPPGDKTTDHIQRQQFAIQFLRECKQAPQREDDWSHLFWDLSQQAATGRVLIILDEITWMGSKDPNFLGKLKNAWDLYFKKNNQLVLALCGSISSWIEKNILSSTGFLGRESMCLTLQELPLCDCKEFWGVEKDRISAYEKLKLLSVTGGIPRYLEAIDPKLSAENNIQQLCYTPHAILLNEFEKIFSDLFSSRSTRYKAIVEYLADGAASQADIIAHLGLSRNGDISEYLDDLIQAGFVSRDFTWHLKDGKPAKLSHYRLKDNYSRFYLKYILPNRSKIESGDMRHIALADLPGWSSIMGLQVENLVLSNRRLIKQALKIDPRELVTDNPFFQRKTNTMPGCQIDYLIQTKPNTLYVCEIKFSKQPLGMRVIREMQDKLLRFKIPKGFSCRPVLIHVNGVSEAVEDEQYFTHIIDFSQWLDGGVH